MVNFHIDELHYQAISDSSQIYFFKENFFHFENSTAKVQTWDTNPVQGNLVKYDIPVTEESTLGNTYFTTKTNPELFGWCRKSHF